jgi:hypothetical protein
MAASFEYEISSKDKSKPGVESAKKGVDGLGKAADKAGKMMKAAFAGITVAAVLKGIQSVNKAFAEQEKVEIRLSAAAKNNPYLNDDAVKGLKEYASALQNVSIFGDEAIIQNQSFLATLNLSESQIKGVMSAAVDLASTGMMSLDAATKNIAKTYGGMTGELGELIPSLKDFTSEQLKNGEAVEYIAKQYEGIGSSMAKSQEGIRTQIKNTFGDIQESLGEIFAGVGGDILREINPALQNIQKWLSDNTEEIIAFFRNLPQIAAETFDFITEVMAELFTSDSLVQLAGIFWEFFKESMVATFQTIAAFLKAIATTIWMPLKFGWDTLVHHMKSAFAAVIEGVAEGINFVIRGLNKVFDFVRLKGIREKFGGEVPDKGIGEISVGAGFSGAAPVWGDYGSNIADAWAGLAQTLPQSIKRIQDAGKQLGTSVVGFVRNNDQLNESFQKFKTNFQSLIVPAGGGAPETTRLASDIAAEVVARGGSVSGVGPYQGRTGQYDPMRAFEPLRQIFGTLGKSLGGFIQSFAMVKQLMDPLSVILSGMMHILQPAIDSILKPLLGILMIVGMFLGQILMPVFEMLAPIIEKIAQVFIWLYNEIFLVIGNGLIELFSFVALSIVEFLNLFLSEKNKISTAGLQNPTLLQAITYAAPADGGDGGTAWSVMGAGDMAAGTSSTAGGSAASYTAGRTINQTVNVYSDVIAGPGGLRELAIMIRDEIYSAEALGA